MIVDILNKLLNDKIVSLATKFHYVTWKRGWIEINLTLLLREQFAPCHVDAATILHHQAILLQNKANLYFKTRQVFYY